MISVIFAHVPFCMQHIRTQHTTLPTRIFGEFCFSRRAGPNVYINGRDTMGCGGDDKISDHRFVRGCLPRVCLLALHCIANSNSEPAGPFWKLHTQHNSRNSAERIEYASAMRVCCIGFIASLSSIRVCFFLLLLFLGWIHWMCMCFFLLYLCGVLRAHDAVHLQTETQTEFKNIRGLQPNIICGDGILCAMYADRRKRVR